MSCENLLIPKPQTHQCPTTLFGIPYGSVGRSVAGTNFPIDGIVLHCYDGTIAELCNEMKCRTRSSVISGSYENSFHYGIGAAPGSGGFQQHVEDANIAWTFGTYKNNTYASVPPPNVAINWPTLQGVHGINTTPDVYTINIALAIGHIVEATQNGGCYTCPTASGLQESQHDMLVQMLAFLAQEYNIPIDADHITFHDLIHCGEGEECPCTDLDTLLIEVAEYCPPCEQEAIVAPEAAPDDEIQYIYGITEPCCPTSPGCAVKIPWDACYVGDLAIDGDLTSYILGLSQDPQTGQWCLTRGCLALLNPLTGCGTVDDPLGIDRCAIEGWLDGFAPLSAVQRVMGVDDNGCWTLQDNDSWFDMVACAQPENSESIPQWVLAKTDNTCPEFVTPGQVVEAGLTVADTDCLDVTFVDGELSIVPIISPVAFNLLECAPAGLQALLTCEAVLENYTTGINIVNLHGDDGGGACGNETLRNAWDRMFCEIEQDPIGVPMWVAVETTTECPKFVPPSNIVVAGLTVVDTNCIDLDLDGDGNLSAQPIISPSIGGVSNVLACMGSGLYVPRGANAAVTGPIIGTGNELTPLDIDFTLLDGQDLCDIGGVIPLGTLTELVGRDNSGCLRYDTVNNVIENIISVQDTDCIDMTFVGGVISAQPIIDPAVDNILECNVNGLYVPATMGVTVDDTNCINLTLNAGVITADPIISLTAGNQISCENDGLFVPLGAGISVQDTNCIDLTLSGVGVITANPIIDPDVTNILECRVNGLYVSDAAAGLILSVANTDCVELNVDGGGELTATPVIAPDQLGVANALSCIAGQGLYVPATDADFIIGVQDGDCTDLDVVGGVLTVDVVVAPNQGLAINNIQCLAGGLFAPRLDFIDEGVVPGGSGIHQIGFDVNGDGVSDEVICIMPCDIVSDNDCVQGVGSSGLMPYMVREFFINGSNELVINSAPEHTALSVLANVAGAANQPAPNGPIGTLVPAPPTIVPFTNPSPCRDMEVDIDFSGMAADISITSLGGAATYSYAIQYEFLVNGILVNNPSAGDFIDTMNGVTFATSERDGPTQGWLDNVTLAPGATVTIEIRPRVRIGLVPANVDLPNSRVNIDPGRLLISGRTV